MQHQEEAEGALKIVSAVAAFKSQPKLFLKKKRFRGGLISRDWHHRRVNKANTPHPAVFWRQICNAGDKSDNTERVYTSFSTVTVQQLPL